MMRTKVLLQIKENKFLKDPKKLRLLANDLTPITYSLTGFTGNSISPLGIMSLHVTFDNEPCSKTMMTKFMVVNILPVYNTIIGQSTLNRLRVVVLISHIVMKFPTIIDVGELRRDPKESCQCYLTIVSLLKKARPETPLLNP